MSGFGSVFRRKDGRWCAKYRDVGGKTRYVYGRTKKEAGERLGQALLTTQEKTEQVYKGESLSVGEYLDLWLESISGTISPRTYERHESIARVHLKSGLGATNLADLSPLDIQRLYRRKLEEGLAPGSVRRIHITLHKALQDGVRWQMLERNAASAAPPPKGTAEEVEALTPKEAKRLLDAARGNRLEALYVLAVTTGMRQGEILALRWDDLDLQDGALRVQRTLWKGETYPPKTKKSRRTVALPNLAIEAIEQHRDRRVTNSQWVFPTRNGTPVNAHYLIGHSWKKMKAKAGLSASTRFHALRHTAATLLLTKGVHPKIVQEMLGHSSISITLDTYSHVLPTLQEKAVEAMESIFE